MPPPPKNEGRKIKLKPDCLKTAVNREQTRQNYRTLFLKLGLKINNKNKKSYLTSLSLMDLMFKVLPSFEVGILILPSFNFSLNFSNNGFLKL